MDRYETLRNVRGSVKMNSTTRPTTAQTMVQVAWPVMTFMAMVKVKMWLPIVKTKKIV